ncbi:MAG: hypothetical protein LBC81_05170 [Tannerellaceae bacterium]|jgi:hypothetical protein|nr:hypothetical protein [Tannerellaceae bacterium]
MVNNKTENERAAQGPALLLGGGLERIIDYIRVVVFVEWRKGKIFWEETEAMPARGFRSGYQCISFVSQKGIIAWHKS